MLELILLIFGIAGLVLGAHLIIRGSLEIAQHYKISQVFIGLTILAIGTDLPELVVVITGAVHRLGGTETSGLILGQAVGSCMGQIALALGVIGLFCYLTLSQRRAIRDGSMMIVSVIMLILVGLDGMITRFDAALFLLIYIVYFAFLQREEKVFEKLKRAPGMDLVWSMISILAGFGVLIYCSNLVVESGVSLAETWGVRQSLIGVVLIGLGTSLPEIIVSLGAIIKKAPMLSVGNLIGSNIFDVLFTLGIGGAISEFVVNGNLLKFDMPYLLITSFIVMLFFLRKRGIQKREAAALIGIYALFIVLKFFGL